MTEFHQDNQEQENNKDAFIISLNSDSLPEASLALRGLAFLLDYI